MNAYINRADIKKKLEKKLSSDQRDVAKGDFHAWREKCVTMLPVISGKDCPLACTYCYIQSMGFQFKSPEPLRLSGEQICYALLENREFIVGKYGTLLAFGHISEPFLPELLDNTLEYFKTISTYLGNPIQFSTKYVITSDLAKKIKSVVKSMCLSPLVTITTLSQAKKLEPGAPPPEKRFQSITNLARAGYKVFLYLRPLIPGIVNTEIEEILKTAKKSGAVGVIAGGFRVTLPIINTMKKAGIDVSEILSRIPHLDEKQRYIYTKDLEENLIQIARNLGLVAVHSTKCAMAYSCNLPCTSLYWIYNKEMCTRCKFCADEVPVFKQSEINKIVKEVFGSDEIVSLQEKKNGLEIKVKEVKGGETRADETWKQRTLETYFRKPVTIQSLKS